MCPYTYNPLLAGKLDITKKKLNDLEDVNTQGTVNGKVLAYNNGTWIPQTAGGGDMLKSVYVTGLGTVYNASRLEGETLATVQAHGVDAGTITSGTIDDARIPNLPTTKITTGTFGLARIPEMDDARIPNLETLSYGAAFAEAQIPNLPTSKITTGTFSADRIPELANLKGTVPDTKIPDVETLSYGAAFGTAQIPSIGAYKVASGTFGLARIPEIDDARIPNLETLSYGAAFGTAQIPSIGAYKIASGTLNAERIPELANLKGTVPDVKIPDVETLSYGAAFAEAQIPSLPTTKITTGTFNANRIPTLSNLKGTLTDVKIPDVESLSYGAAFAVAQIPNLPTSKITTGTFGLARIPTMDDAHIPNLETLSYSAAFGTAQIPNLAASKITSGTFNVNRIDTLDNLKGTVTAAKVAALDADKITTGTFGLARVPTMDDAHIPDVETLSYGAAFGTAQIPSIGAYKVASGTFGLARIPTMDDAHIPDVETLSYTIPFSANQIPALDTSFIASGTFNSDRIPVLPTDRYGSAVLLTGDQTIEGTKTFGAIPILPASNPTLDNEAARKAYVDAQAGAVTEGTYSTSFTFGSAQAVQDAGTAFTISGFMTYGYIKEVDFRANYTCGTLSSVTAKVNNSAGILPAGTVIANDGRSGTFLVGDYIESANEIMRIVGTISADTLIVSRGKKGSGAGFINDNQDIVKLNNGFTLWLFKDSNENKYEAPLELSSLMTAKGVTDASISAGNKRIELSADLKNVDALDTVRLDDGADSEEVLVQNNVGECVNGTYDFSIFVYDALGSHPSGLTVEKVCKYDIPTNYKSTAGTLHGRLHLMENLGSNLNININIKGDEFC